MLPNDRLASVNQKGELRIWDVKSGKCLKTVIIYIIYPKVM
jgi:WD40 repeat protein